MPDIKPLRTWFRTYVAEFADADGRLQPMQELKLEHSLRVAANARQIAAGERWPAAACRLAECVGILHDVGRFSQFAEFRTFEDAVSVNHAARSVAVLGEREVLACLPAPARASVLNAVGAHNAREIPPEFPAGDLPLLQLIRDADKLDIFYVFDDAIRHRKLSLYPEISLRVDLHGPPNPEVVERVRNRQSTSYGLVRSLADFLLLQLLWMHELQYRATCALVLERGVIEALAGHLPPTPAMAELVAAAREHVQRRCE